MKKEYIYKRFERFWHWSQAGLILFLSLTGFEVHDSIHVFGFAKAVLFHRIAAYLLLGLIVFAIFWHFTTGEWKQYIPTVKKLKEQIRYYTLGIFKNEPHPTKKTALNKLNPAGNYLSVIQNRNYSAGGRYRHSVFVVQTDRCKQRHCHR
jgi:thiosulfate reductase cytochrome b subunit